MTPEAEKILQRIHDEMVALKRCGVTEKDATKAVIDVLVEIYPFAEAGLAKKWHGEERLEAAKAWSSNW